MDLTTLLSNIDAITSTGVLNCPQTEVNGISHDTRELSKGDVFVALNGENFDGHQYIDLAIKKGAIAIVGEKDIPILRTIPYIKVKNTRLALAQLSAAFYEYPAKLLNVIGVTGTDGKTTTVNLIHHILTKSGINAGMVSTVNAIIGNETIDTGFHVTTPEAPKVQAILKKMVDAGLSHVVLEATSHGLEQYRVAECYFDVGVVTNITHEHLDYHGDYANYLKAKSRLIKWMDHEVKKPLIPHPFAIINRDDISYQPLKEIIQDYFGENLTCLDYGMSNSSSIRALNINTSSNGLAFEIAIDGQLFHVKSKMIGTYNVFNILAAVSAAYFTCGIGMDSIIDAIASFAGVPGRMEEINLGQSFTAIVDFAHTPNALKVALETSRSYTKKRVIAVFGSAGLRDREKRRMMAATSIKEADITIITAEDPRTEKLDDILSEMRDEASKYGGVEGINLFIVPDRGKAIEKAVYLAEAGDLVIACGKGHEQSMCFGEIEYPWDDRIALRSALASLLHKEGPQMPYLPTQD